MRVTKMLKSSLAKILLSFYSFWKCFNIFLRNNFNNKKKENCRLCQKLEQNNI